MASGIIGQAQIANALRTMMAEAENFGEHQNVYKGTVTVHTLPRKMGRDYNIPRVPPLTAVSVAADSEYDSPQQISDQKVTITPAEVIVQVELGLRAEATSTLNLMSNLGEGLANAVERKREQDGLAMYDGFGAVLGSTSTTLTVDLVAKAVTQIKSGRPGTSGTAATGALTTGDKPKGPYSAVFHPYNQFDLVAQLSGMGGVPTQVTTGAAVMNYSGNTAFTDFQRRMIEEGQYGGMIGGASIYFTGNFTIASTAIKGGVYAKPALRHVTFSDYEEKPPWYSKDHRFVVLTAVADYGNGEFSDTYGIEVDVDASVTV